MAGARTFAAGNFFLELGGAKGGYLRSVEGGNVKGEVVREARGRGGFVKKSLGGTAVEPFAVELGLGLDKSVYAWMAEAWAGKQKPRDGAIVAADASFVAKQRREFSKAVITEVSIPALDAGSKVAAFLTVRFAPGDVVERKASGKLPAAASKKAWLPSNFRLEIDGLDCKKVSRIDGFTVPCAPPVDFPDLRISVAEAGAQTWLDWHRTFLREGRSSDGDEKKGRLILLAPDLKTALGEIRLFGLGIYRLAARKQEGGEAIRRLVADLYCERMELDLG